MEKTKRIRVIFKDEEILSEANKLEGLKRSWILFKPQEHRTVSDVVSHLLRSFQLHDSCPDGLLLSVAGFVLPSFESSCILKDDEVISVRKKKKKEILLIEDNHGANGAGILVAQERIRMPILQLENVACEKKKGKFDSDESEEVDEEILFADPGTSNLNPQNRKRRTNEMLSHSKKKKKRYRETRYADEDAPENLENSCKEKYLVEKEVIKSLEKKDNEERNVENDSEEAISADMDDVKRNSQGEENMDTSSSKHARKVNKRGPSRSARRKTARRHWLQEMEKIGKQNARCESESLRNWREDKAKSEKNKQKWRSIDADPKANLEDGGLKGLLHWKPSSSPQNGQFVNGKKRGRHRKYLHKPSYPEDVENSKNRLSDENSPQPVVNGNGVQCLITENGVVDGKSNQKNLTVERYDCAESDKVDEKTDEENEFVPIVIRPGHIRFEPLDEEEEAVRKSPAQLVSYQWNGITSKKKGQKWGQENRFSATKIDRKTSNNVDEKSEQTESISFDELPSLSGLPKEGDVIAYRILELSSTWTPELSDFRVGKVSRYHVESNQTTILPVPEYPIFPENTDEDDAQQQHPDNSVYKDDGSLETDFSSLVDVRIVKRVSSEPQENGLSGINKNTSGTEKNIWDQLSEALSAKKEVLQKKKWGERQSSSGNRSWSYKALRSSALGPVMAILRSEKDA